MSDESRPFKGPFQVRWTPFCMPAVIGRDSEIFKGQPDEAEQIRLALELLELLPRIERYIEAGISMGDLNESMSLHAAIQALKEPRP